MNGTNITQVHHAIYKARIQNTSEMAIEERNDKQPFSKRMLAAQFSTLAHRVDFLNGLILHLSQDWKNFCLFDQRLLP